MSEGQRHQCLIRSCTAHQRTTISAENLAYQRVGIGIGLLAISSRQRRARYSCDDHRRTEDAPPRFGIWRYGEDLVAHSGASSEIRPESAAATARTSGPLGDIPALRIAKLFDDDDWALGVLNALLAHRSELQSGEASPTP